MVADTLCKEYIFFQIFEIKPFYRVQLLKN
jgi:hypothetical protein